MFTEYKGFYIEFNFYGNNQYSIQFCGDDLIFNSKEDAYNFIDNLEKEGVNNEN